ncbi:7911_t:CDS:2, partial [Scutellospora calospora]
LILIVFTTLVHYSTSIVGFGNIRYRKKKFKEPDSPLGHDLADDDLLMYETKENGGSFFIDMHPPLARLLFTFAGVLGGYDGNFDFENN